MPFSSIASRQTWRMASMIPKRRSPIEAAVYIINTSKNCSRSCRSNTTGTAIYALGEGWTGALGNGTLDLTSPDYGKTLTKMNFFCSEEGEEVEDIATGWGHTAIISSTSSTTGVGTKRRRRLYICGRPHEFRTILRLKRLPGIVRKMACALSWQHTYNSATMDEELNPYLPQPSGEGSISSSSSSSDETASTNSIFRQSLALLNRLGREQQIMPHQSQSKATSTEPHQEQQRPFHPAAKLNILLSPTEIPIPSLASDEVYGIQNPLPSSEMQQQQQQQHAIAASAGFTAVICPDGRLYTFGLNPYGQCGVGYESNNVWTCTPVVGLTTQSSEDDDNITVTISGNMVAETSPRSKLTQQQYPIVSVALGLQHAIALDSMGNVYTFGKGERGQLGNGRAASIPYAVHVPIHSRLLLKQEQDTFEEKYVNSSHNSDQENSERLERARARYLRKISSNSSDSSNTTSTSPPFLQVSHIAAGFNHCACATTTNHVFIWGKNTVFDKKTNKYEDSYAPIMVPGLPLDKKVIDVSCGSRHTSILLEDGSIWAIGIAFDNGAPLLDKAVKIMNAPSDGAAVKYFKSSFDKTIVVTDDNSGISDDPRKQKVRFLNLWSTEELRMDEHADTLLQEEPEWVGQIDCESEITMVDAGWLHTVVVTKTDGSI